MIGSRFSWMLVGNFHRAKWCIPYKWYPSKKQTMLLIEEIHCTSYLIGSLADYFQGSKNIPSDAGFLPPIVGLADVSPVAKPDVPSLTHSIPPSPGVVATDCFHAHVCVCKSISRWPMLRQNHQSEVR